MDSFINNSLTFKIVNFLRTTYDSSRIMRFSSIMSTIYGFSIYSKIINRYMRQKSYAEKTFTYLILSRIGRFFDAIVGYFHTFLANCIKNSTVNQLYKTFISECKYHANYFVMDYEKVTYFVGLYAILDFIMRKVISSAFLAGYWDELFLIFCFMIWFYKWFIYRKQKPYKWTPLEFPIMIFFGISIFLLLANSPDMRIGIEGLRAIIQYIFWYFVVMQLLKSTNAARRLIYVLVLTGGALGLHGVFQYITGVYNPPNWQDKAEMAVRTRVFSVFGTPNVLASLMVLLLPLSIALVISEKNRIKKLIFGCTTLLMSASLVFTFTRGAWLAFIIVLFIFVFLKDKRLILPSVFALIIGSALIAIFIPSVANRVLYLISPEYLASAAKGGRIHRFFESLYLIKNNLWFGLGLGQFGGSVALNNKIPGAFSVDNYYVKTAVEMGLLGFSAFCILIYNVIIWSIRTIVNLKDKYFKTLTIGAFAGLCGVLLHNFTENMFEVPTMTVYFWSIVAFIMFVRYSNDLDSSRGNPMGRPRLSEN